MGSGRLFRRQKDIPVFIEGEFYCTPKRNVVKRFGVLNGKWGTLHLNRLSLSNVSISIWNFTLSIVFLLYFPVLPLFCISGPGKGIHIAGRFRLGARGFRGFCCVGRIHTIPCYQGPEWCHALLYCAWYVCVRIKPLLCLCLHAFVCFVSWNIFI